MTNIWDSGPSDPVDCLVLVYLANFSNDDGEHCFPSIGVLAKMTRYSEKTISRAVASLEAEGWLTVERGDGRGHRSHYSINVEKIKGGLSVPLPQHKRGTLATVKGDFDDRKGDFGDLHNRKNHQEPSGNRQTPQSPPEAVAGFPASPGDSPEETLDDSAIASGVLVELGLSGRELRANLDSIVKSERKRGKGADELLRELCSAWRTYERAGPMLRFTYGPAAFFGNGAWRNTDSWSWKIESPNPTDEERERVREVFAVYCRKTGRDPAIYTLNDDRMDCGIARLRYLRKRWPNDAHEGLLLALSGMMLAKEGRRKNADDWSDHLMDSDSNLDKLIDRAERVTA